MIARKMKRHLDSDVVRLSDVEALIGKDVEIIVLKDSSAQKSADAGLRKRIRGSAKGKVWISPDFDKPLPDDMLSHF
jgi:hypothetical protein